MAKRYKNESTGQVYYEGRPLTHFDNNVLWSGNNPTPEQLTEWGYVEYVPPVVEPEPIPIEQQYKFLVVEKVRERYSMDDELAIQRQRDSKPEEFAEYNAYCEQCKADAREELNYNESQEE